MSEFLQNLAAGGDALAGFASVLALIAAAFAANAAWRTLGVERQRDAHAREREESEQAALVSSWCASRDAPRPKGPGKMRALVIRNASTAPVYEVCIRSTWAQTAKSSEMEQPVCKIAVLPPGDYFVEEDTEFPWSFPREFDGARHRVNAVMNNPKWIVQSMEFTDGRGVRWSRDRVGQLAQQ